MTINVDEIRENALIGVRRAAVFLGFSINCANNESLVDFSLRKHSIYDLVPAGLNAAMIAEYKLEYKSWVIANAFRELVDSFEVYLDQVFSVAELLKPSGQQPKAFLKYGIDKKLSWLYSKHQIKTGLNESFDTFTKVRNCLYHRRGFVGHQDLDHFSGSLVVRWLGTDIVVTNKKGKERVVSVPIVEPVEVEAGEGMSVANRERRKSFAVGELVSFSVDELLEICFHFHLQVGALYESLMKFFARHNIVLTRPETARES